MDAEEEDFEDDLDDVEGEEVEEEMLEVEW